MSRTDALSPLTVNTQRVNGAVGVAVRRKMSETTSVDNRRALESTIGRRIQGEYGAQLRALAEADPELSAAELCEAVIVPVEWPLDNAPEPTIYSGERDRARAKRYGPFLEDHDESLIEAVIWCAGVLKAKSAIAEPVTRPPEHVRPISDELASEMSKARAALVEGREQGATSRRLRRERVSA